MASSCAVCNKTLDLSRSKDLRKLNEGSEEDSSFLRCLTELMSSGGKSKTVKLHSEQTCLPCYRDIVSFSEIQNVFLKKQEELVNKISHTKILKSKSGRKKVDNSNNAPSGLVITKELISIPVPDEYSEHITLTSMLSNLHPGMDAEITITKENGESALVEVEVVEGISDLKKPNGLFGCRFCKKEFIKANYVINHMQEHHGKLLHQCNVCHQEFRQKAELDQHRASHLNEAPLPYQCGSCPQGFDTFEAFQVHTIQHQQKKKYGCAQCGRKYNDESKLTRHMANHKLKPFSCHRCKKSFRSRHTCLKHQKLHGDIVKFNCDICKKHFSSADLLHNHLKNHKKHNRCDVCAKVFDTQLLLSKHSETHNDKRFGCNCCGKQFASSVRLEMHMRVHTGERPYQCEACGNTFAQRSNLDSHIRSVHLQMKPFKCDECGKSFKRRRLLDVHVRSAHTGEKPFKCEICNAAFAYPEHRKKHLKTHSGSKPHSCIFCDKRFTTKDNLSAHLYSHSSRKPFECKTCSKGFMRKNQLIQHMEELNHGDPETDGVNVKLKFTYPPEPEVEEEAILRLELPYVTYNTQQVSDTWYEGSQILIAGDQPTFITYQEVQETQDPVEENLVENLIMMQHFDHGANDDALATFIT